MKRNGRLPELLAPAGGEQAFLAAIAAGADAVYLGGKAYNARAFAENFDDETLARCVALAHARGVRVYVTLNTLLYAPELTAAADYAVRLWRMGVDALIVADVGLADELHRRVPALELHASTQLTLHSSTGAQEVSDLGFTQVVAARELPKNEIGRMVDLSPGTVEIFLHGALCVSHSGQCLFSSMVGGRSGNRGACAQPCRLPYNDGKYLLSLKDLSLAGHIPELIASGVSTLKIEGRMKSADYVGRVTAIYRRLLDEGRCATAGETRELERIFSRSGFTDGYFTGRTDTGMTGVRSEQDKEESRAAGAQTPPPTPARLPLTAEVRIVAGEPAQLTLRAPGGRTATVAGETPAAAKNAPLTAAGVCERLAKLGGTPFSLAAGDIRLTLGEGLNLSPAALNALRRDAVAHLLDTTRECTELPTAAVTAPPFAPLGRTALFCDAAQYDAARGEYPDFFDLVFLPLWQWDKTPEPPRGVWLPPVIFDGEEPEIRQHLDDAKRRGATHALVGNPAQVRIAREAGLIPVGDFRLNVLNPNAAAYYARHGVVSAVLSPELTLAGMRDIGGQTIAYGRVPLMLTERCYMKPLGGCAACGKKPLVDRRGIAFPVLRIPPHRNMIVNSVPTYLGDRQEQIPPGVGAHFLFTSETPATVCGVISRYLAGEALSGAVCRPTKTRR